MYLINGVTCTRRKEGRTEDTMPFRGIKADLDYFIVRPEWSQKMEIVVSTSLRDVSVSTKSRST